MSDLSEQAELLRQTQARLQHLEAAQQRQAAAHRAVLDALPGHFALLDAQGVIVAVNQAWQQFADANGGCSPDFGIGRNYLMLCDAVVGGDADDASAAARCIRAVLGQPGAQTSLDYPCHTPGDVPGDAPAEQRWFRMTATGLAARLGDPASGGAVVMHTDISARWRAEAEARRSSALLQAVADGTSDHVFVKDTRSRYLLCNQALAKFLGRTSEQMIGLDKTDLLQPDDALGPAESDRQVFESGRALTAEYALSVGGQTRTFLTSKAPYRDEQGRVIGLVGIARDITEHRRAEQERDRERALMRTLIDAIPDAVYTRDKAARVVICNPAAASAFGVAGIDDLVGRTSLEVLPPDFAASRYAEDMHVLAGHAMVRLEVPSTDHQGQPVWTLMTKLPLRDGRGEVVGLLGILRDISEQKRALAQAERLSAELGVALASLEAEQARLVSAQAMARIGSWTVDLASGSAQWSREMHRMLQTDPARVTPGLECYLERMDPAERAATREAFARSCEQGHCGVREERLLLPDGSSRIVEARWQVECDAQGRPLRAQGTCQDITERKQAESTLRQQQALFGMVLRLGRIGAWAVDLTQDQVVWSDEVCAIHDMPPGTLPTFEQAVAYYPPEWAGIVSAATTACARQGTPFDLEAEIITARGRRIWVRAIGEAVPGERGEIRRIQGAFQDLSERKQAELERAEVSRRSEQRERMFSKMLAALNDLAYAFDADGCFLFANQPLLDRWGISLDQALGRNFRELGYPADLAETLQRQVRQVFDSGVSVTGESPYTMASGQRIHYEYIYSPAFGADGRVEFVVGTTRDVSERKRAEQASRQLASHLSDTIESLTDGFCTFDRDWRVTHVNAVALRTASRPREQVVGRVLWDEFPYFLGTPFERGLRRALNDGVVTTTEAYLEPWQGWFSAKAYPSEAGLTVHIRDVTAEHAARRHLELLEASVSQLNDLVLIADSGRQDQPGLRILFVNEAFVRITGHARSDVVGQSPRLLYGPLTDPIEIERMRIAGERREAVRAEVLIYRQDGQTFWADVDVVPVEVQGETASHFVVIARDISERKQARLALHELNAGLEARVLSRTAEATQAREEAERANRAKSAFLATMSHEIRTPMNGVMGMIDVLHQTSLKGYQVEMVDLIRDSADTLLAIIDDILDFSKIEAGKLQIEQEPMQLADTVEKVCAMLDHMAVKRGVRMMVFVDPAIPRVVAGDETRVRQVLVNLCSNAIKFSSGLGQAGEMSVRVTLLAQDAQGVHIELTVADNGIGMDESALARLFTPFSQADGSTTRRFGGTGLGLAITGTLVRLMGGEINVRSTRAAGSSFSVRLRFASVADALNEEPVAPAAGLNCRIVGTEQPLAHDLSAYLAHAGAAVEQLPDLAAAAAAPAPAGLCVWLILPGQDVPDLAALRAMAPGGLGDGNGSPGHSASDGASASASASDGGDDGDSADDIRTRFVVLGRGARRRLRVEAADLVSVDADAMFRSTLIKALSLAAGRVQRASPSDAAGSEQAPAQAPPRHEARAQGRLILVAEDNETNRLVIERQIALIGYAADVVVNGREALEHWRSGDYALLLTDLHMPEMDGHALAAAIRAEESERAHGAGAPRTPILALTANALHDEERLCRASGMDAYLTKPIRLAQLRRAIEVWLAPANRGAGAAALESLPAESAPAVVDLNVLRAQVGDDPLAVGGVLRAFRVSVEQMADELRRAAAAGSLHALEAVAHKMKSGARAIGAARLGEVCAAIEQAGGDPIMTTLWPRLQGELQAVLAFLDLNEDCP